MTHTARPLELNPIVLAVAAVLGAAGPAAFANPAPGAAVGTEFRVNTTTLSRQIMPSVAMDAAGDYVVVWASKGQDNVDGSYGVYAQRYAADGTALGGEFQVNNSTPYNQMAAHVAMDSTGDFVVTWQSLQNGTDFDIYARRYAADGTPAGGEFRVNTTTPGPQDTPDVAMDAAGDFVITWHSYYNYGPGGHVLYAQRYAADGAPIGSEFQVLHSTVALKRPSIAMDTAGDFVVAYQGKGPDNPDGSYGIYAQLFNPDGTQKRAGFLVNTTTAGNQKQPKAVMDAAGNFVVVWQSKGQDNADGSYGIYGQRFAADGSPVNGEFRVNTTTASVQADPSAAMDVAGEFIVTWDSLGQDGAAYGVYAQRYAADGTTVGGEFRVNTYIPQSQYATSAAMDPVGDVVVAWQSYIQDYSSDGIYAQRYARESTLDLSAGLTLSPSGSIAGNSSLTLTASIVNNAIASNSSGNAVIDTALTAASGVTATIALPAGANFISANGTNWNCPATVSNGLLACQYGAILVAGEVTPSLTLSVTAPNVLGAADFTSAASGDQPDGTSGNDIATASVDVTDRAPVASDGSLSLDKGTAGGGSLSATDADGDPLTYAVVSNPAHGVVAINSDGSYSYTPAAHYAGVDSFRFKANDGTVDSNTASVSVTVNDNAPAASAGSLAANRNTAKSGVLTGTDLDSDPLMYAAVTNPAHGTLTLNSNGSYSYKPAQGYAGTDSFTFKANDGMVDSAPATVSITVTEHAPVATAQTFSMTRNTVHKGTLKFTDKDAGDKHTFSKSVSPKHGTVSINSSTGAFSYTPAKNYFGKDSFVFKVSDGMKSDTATVSITVK